MAFYLKTPSFLALTSCTLGLLSPNVFSAQPLQKVAGMPFSAEILPVWNNSNVPALQVPQGVKPNGPLSLQEEWTAAHVTPHARQADWQEMAMIGFVHFGPNTFSGNEWGSGKEHPGIFNPSKLDCHQWVKALKAAGCKLVIFTAKHHDGFCLWPSRFTGHSVKSSPWKGGRGDVLKELSEACRKEDMKLGIYLSPADLNAMETGVYGTTASKKRTIPSPVPGWKPKSDFKMEGEWDEYNTYFLNQLFEVLTEYGTIDEVWFDGAHPKPGSGQKYDYAAWLSMIRTLAPNAVIQGKGPDVRWIGNERGDTRKDEWNVTPTSSEEHFRDRTEQDLGSDALLKGKQHLIWLPGETDVSIRPGWFYHRDQDNRLHSLQRCLDMWYGSAGGNAVLLLNVPPTPEGLFHPNDVARLKEMGQVLQATFANNLAAGARFSVSSGELGKDALVDAKTDTGWKPADWQRSGEVEITLPQKREFNRIELRENIRQHGQRVKHHAVDAFVDGAWKQIVDGNTIGGRRIHRVDNVKTDKLRIRILDSRVCPTLAEFGLYLEPRRVDAPVITRDSNGKVTISAGSGLQVRYTTDGSQPGAASNLYQGPFDLPDGGVVRAEIVGTQSAKDMLVIGAPVAQAEYGPLKNGWKILAVSSEETRAENAAAKNAIDDDPATVWHTQWQAQQPRPPHSMSVDMGKELDLSGFTYLPRQRGPWVSAYRFETSLDGKQWKSVSENEFGNIVNNPVQQVVRFAPVKARYFRFTAKSEAQGQPFVTVAELGVLTSKPTR